MKFIGKIIAILPEIAGVSKSSGNPWRKRDIVIEGGEENSDPQFARQLCIGFFGDKADVLNNYTVGMSVSVCVNVESRESNGRWFTSLNAYRIEIENQNAQPPQSQQYRQPVAQNYQQPYQQPSYQQQQPQQNQGYGYTPPVETPF